MVAYALETLATPENFDEARYLACNPDVARAVRRNELACGREHFEAFGQVEQRLIRVPPSAIAHARQAKLERIAGVLRDDMAVVHAAHCYDFLSAELRAQFAIVDTDAVSANPYDERAMALIEQHAGGLVLDCGAGRRPVYFDNVVNFDIVDYDSTDVRGVGEVLPFRDDSFDAVISIAVLEHVKDPFRCARELARVLKPGGRLMCCVPFLQPLHGYPHHYYNMSHQGLRNLFDDRLEIDGIEVYDSVLPIASLSWILHSWAAGLTPATRGDFLNMRVADLMQPPNDYLGQAFVTELSAEKNRELASANVLFAHKRALR